MRKSNIIVEYTLIGLCFKKLGSGRLEMKMKIYNVTFIHISSNIVTSKNKKSNITYLFKACCFEIAFLNYSIELVIIILRNIFGSVVLICTSRGLWF